MTKLSVNLNKIALIRNSRGRNYPNLTNFAEKTLKLGASGITVHPRPDQRHIRYDDIAPLKEMCAKYNVELNVEGYPNDEFINLCISNRVYQVTLVPDSPNQLTSDHGWVVSENRDKLLEVIKSFSKQNIKTSLFMDLSTDEIQLAKEIGADAIEIHTESYARSFENNTHFEHIKEFILAFNYAKNIGLQVNAGHDLSLENLSYFLSNLPVNEVSIGHALTVESLERGWSKTILEYKDICSKS